MKDQFIAWGLILGGILLILLRNRFRFGGDEGIVSRNPPQPTRGAAITATVAGVVFVVRGVLALMGKL